MPLFQEVPDNPALNEHGLVAIGGDLRPDTLRKAYRAGVFPWPMEGMPLTWFSPHERAILDFDDLHLSRSLERAQKQAKLRFSFDESFPEVIRACASVHRPGQHGTWITPEMLEAYSKLHQRGDAHSAEAWDGDTLVAGIYGVDIDGAFSAESMFHRKPNASKLLLVHLIRHFHAQGLSWLDIQVMTPHLEKLGAKLIPRDEFLVKLARTRALGLRLFPSSSG